MSGGDRDTASDSATGRSENGLKESGRARRSGGKAGSPKAAQEPARRWNYPSAEDHPDEEIFVHRKWCKSCGICYSMCPKGVITADKAGRPIVARPGDCIVCGLCEVLCPDMAITVHKTRKTNGEKQSSDRSDARRDENAGPPESGND